MSLVDFGAIHTESVERGNSRGKAVESPVHEEPDSQITVSLHCCRTPTVRHSSISTCIGKRSHTAGHTGGKIRDNAIDLKVELSETLLEFVQAQVRQISHITLQSDSMID